MQMRKVMGKGKTIYQLKITLRYFKPLIWRRIFINANIKLPDLHKIIQVAMGWTNTHLHQSRIYNDVYCEPDEEYYHEYFDYTKVKLNSLGNRAGYKFYRVTSPSCASAYPPAHTTYGCYILCQ